MKAAEIGVKRMKIDFNKKMIQKFFIFFYTSLVQNKKNLTRKLLFLGSGNAHIRKCPKSFHDEKTPYENCAKQSST